MDKLIRYSRRAVTEKYATFTGRDTRAQYWWFVLGVVIVALVLNLLAEASAVFATLSVLFAIAVLVPSLAATTRRLHDTGRSGWWQLVQLIPFAGLALIVYFTVQSTSPGSNKYGDEPVGEGPALSSYPPPPPPPPPSL